MASDVMSLFGLDPQILQSQRAQAGVDQASRMSADYAVGAAGGTMLGAGINSMLGLQTPEMQQAAQVQQSLAGVDINDAAGLRRAASQLMANGQYAQAMTLYQQARELEQASAEELRTQQTHEMGNTVQVTVGQEWDQLNQKWVAQKNTVTFFGDGSVEDATLGKKFDSRAEWLEAVREGAPAQEGGDTDVDLDPETGLVRAKEVGKKNALDREIEKLESDIRVTHQNIEHAGYGWAHEGYKLELQKQQEKLDVLKKKREEQNKDKQYGQSP